MAPAWGISFSRSLYVLLYHIVSAGLLYLNFELQFFKIQFMIEIGHRLNKCRRGQSGSYSLELTWFIGSWKLARRSRQLDVRPFGRQASWNSERSVTLSLVPVSMYGKPQYSHLNYNRTQKEVAKGFHIYLAIPSIENLSDCSFSYVFRQLAPFVIVGSMSLDESI